MSLSNLSSAQISRIIQLVKEKEYIQGKLSDIERELDSFESGAPLHRQGRKPGRPPGSKTAGSKPAGKRRGKRLKDRLLKALENAGASGITVKELAAELKVKPGNVFSWFYTTGKKISSIKKVGEAKYALKT